MKISIPVVCTTFGIGFAAFCIAAAEPHVLLSQVQKVYVLPMSGGMDQYIANQLTKKGLLEVVTDPKLADSVLTEAIGSGFEARLTELLPPPPAPVPDKAATPEKGRKTETATSMEFNGAGPAVRTSSFGRGRGNLFLVDLKSRSVVWSIYRLPKNRTPQELDHTSASIADELGKDLKQK